MSQQDFSAGFQIGNEPEHGLIHILSKVYTKPPIAKPMNRCGYFGKSNLYEEIHMDIIWAQSYY